MAWLGESLPVRRPCYQHQTGSPLDQTTAHPGQIAAKSGGSDKILCVCWQRRKLSTKRDLVPTPTACRPLETAPTLMPVWMLWIFWLLVFEGVAITTRTLLFPQLKRPSFARADAVSKAGSCLLSTTNSTSTCPPAIHTGPALIVIKGRRAWGRRQAGYCSRCSREGHLGRRQVAAVCFMAAGARISMPFDPMQQEEALVRFSVHQKGEEHPLSSFCTMRSLVWLAHIWLWQTQ